jgi:hypothetical protein
MKKRRVTVTITEVQYRTQEIEVDVPKEIEDDDVCEFLIYTDFEVDDDVEWETYDGYEENDIAGVDSDRFDVYRGGEQVTGGHL